MCFSGVIEFLCEVIDYGGIYLIGFVVDGV